jgi:uncharacterized protein (DUF885 family)
MPDTDPFEICDRLTESYADLSPIAATGAGIPGRDHLWDDMSPEGEEAKAALLTRGIAELAPHLGHPEPVQARAAQVVSAYLTSQRRLHDSGQWKRDLNHIYSPFQTSRDVFDIMPREGPEAWDNIRARFSTWPGLLVGHRASLEVGLEEGLLAARRQVLSVIEQVRAAAGPESRFADFPSLAAAGGGEAGHVENALSVARSALDEFADWLEMVYLPRAESSDAAGRERYVEESERFLGIDLDPDDTYEWGWAEVHRLLDEMRATAAEIDPGRTVDEVIDLLDTDPARSAPDHEAFVEFVRGIQSDAVGQLDGTAFDVPSEIREVTVNLAPPGGSLGAWYHPPSEDFTRPGSIWYALGERARIPHWQEVATAYHEGFPGHHLQVGTAVLQRESLSRFHRLLVWYPGSGEGWALYAERLMEELGYFENPEYRLGLLASQLFRSTRVVVDIGAHLQKRIPRDAPLHPGEVWDYGRAVDYMENIGRQAHDVAVSEVLRYLGWPAQAISYKVGEREILDIRRQAMTDAGASFDSRDFHRRLLEAGAIRLDHLRRIMA